MSRIWRMSLLTLLAIGALALVGCGSDDNGDDADGEVDPTTAATEVSGSDETTVEFTLSDFEIAGPASAPAGAIRFDVTNDSAQLHELVIVRSDAATDALPIVDALVPEADLDLIGEIEEFPGGEERSGTFTLDAGRYLLICNIAGHYQLGMVSEFTVE